MASLSLVYLSSSLCSSALFQQKMAVFVALVSIVFDMCRQRDLRIVMTRDSRFLCPFACAFRLTARMACSFRAVGRTLFVSSIICFTSVRFVGGGCFVCRWPSVVLDIDARTPASVRVRFFLWFSSWLRLIDLFEPWSRPALRRACVPWFLYYFQVCSVSIAQSCNVGMPASSANQANV